MNSLKLKALSCNRVNTSSRAHLKAASSQSEFPKLSWDDFQAKPNSESKFYAYSYWKIVYSYKVTISAGRAIIVAQAKCVFEKDRSWVKEERKSQELLEHEQGHYYIGCLCALTFKKRVKSTTFSKANYGVELKKLFKDTLQEFVQLEKLYDEETCHYKNKEQQRSWDKSIGAKIEDLKAFWWPEVFVSENFKENLKSFENIDKIVEKSESLRKITTIVA